MIHREERIAPLQLNASKKGIIQIFHFILNSFIDLPSVKEYYISPNNHTVTFDAKFRVKLVPGSM